MQADAPRRPALIPWLVGLIGLAVSVAVVRSSVAPIEYEPPPAIEPGPGYDLLVSATQRLYQGPQVAAVYAVKDKSTVAPEIRVVAAADRETLDELRQAIELGWHLPRQDITAPNQLWSRARESARRLAEFEAASHELDGDLAQAVSSSLNAVELGAILPRQGNLLACLVGSACEAIGLKPLRGLVLRLSADEARVAQARVERILARRIPIADAWANETVAMSLNLAEALHKPRWRSDLTPTLYGVSVGERMVIATSSRRGVYARARRRMTERQAWLEQPWQPGREMPVERHPLLAYALPSPDSVDFRDRATRASLHQLRAALAIQAYRREHDGDWPESLAALVPEYLSDLPLDPFSDQPLRYRPGGPGFGVWSVGPNGVDDDGMPARRPDGAKWQALRVDDLGDDVLLPL